MKENRFLLDYRKDVASQFGEDGIIEKIFEIIPRGNTWCVEFGAWDGKRYSNTYNLIANKGWSAVLIEGDSKRAKEISRTYPGNAKVKAIASYVTSSGDTSLDNLLSPIAIPRDFDLLSIDIDGNDYHVWRGIQKYKPKVVVIEFNSFIPGNVEFIQKDDGAIKHGNSILSLVKLGKEKGYELVSINQENAFFVDTKYFPLFNIKDNSIESLKHFREPLQVYQLYDGTFRFHGSHHLYYYGLKVDLNRKFQIMPKWIRDRHIPWKEHESWFDRLLWRFIRRTNRTRVPDDSNKADCWSWKEKY